MLSEIQKYNFDDTVNRLNDLLLTMDSWRSLKDLSSTQVFVRSFATITDQLAYYISESYRDLKFGTTKNIQSVLSYAKIWDINLRRDIPSYFTVRIYIDGVKNENIFIPKWTLLKFENLYFSTYEACTLFQGQTYVDVKAVQGLRNTYQFNSSGVADFYIDLEIENISNYDPEVFVDGEFWSCIDNFFEYSSIDKVCKQLTIYKGLRIMFGDGVYGKIPPLNSIIEVTVFETEGKEGNFLKLNQEGSVITDIFDSYGQKVNLSVINLTVASSGQEKETLKEFKLRFPIAVRKTEVYIKKSELKMLFEELENIKYASVVFEQDRNPDNLDYTNLFLIDIYYVPVGSVYTEEEKKDILAEFVEQGKLLMNTAYRLFENEELYFRHEITLYVKPSVNQVLKSSIVQDRIESFYESFIFGDNWLYTNFSDAIRFYEDNDGNLQRDSDIINSHISILLGEHLSSLDGYFEGVLLIKPINYFAIEWNGQKIFETTSTGDFSNAYVTGSIDFTTGAYSFTINNYEADDTCEVLYKSSDVDVDLQKIIYPYYESCLISFEIV